MAYCKTIDVQHAAGGEKRLRELADWDKNSTPDMAVIFAVIEEAGAWIDSYLSKRYRTPIAVEPTPAIIRTICANEAAFIMKRNRTGVTELDQIHHEERAKMLEDISVGRVTLGVFAQPEKSSLVVDRTGTRGSRAELRKKYRGFS